MADWKRLLKEILLTDGSIDESETSMLKNEILQDAVVDNEEIDFLVELRNSAKTVCKGFEMFFFDALKRNILADNAIDEEEVVKLRAIIFADGKVDEAEKVFLKDLKSGAKKTCASFDILLSECLKK